MKTRCKPAGNKIKYRTFDEAERTMIVKNGYGGAKDLAVFKCDFCGSYHFGHTKESGKYDRVST